MSDAIRIKILIIDDDLSLRMLVRATLEQEGFDVFEARNCQEGNAAFFLHKPDLVLLDVMMPDGNGYDVCAQLRSTIEGRDTPIVMVTGLDDVNSINRAYVAGATDFITKPINWGVLAHRVRYILRSANAIRELKRTETKNSALLNAIPDHIFVFDANGRCQSHQAGLGEIASLSHCEGKFLSDLFGAETATTVLNGIAGVIALKQPWQVEFVLNKAATTIMEARISPFEDNQALAIVRDVSHQKKTEVELRLAASVFESSGEAIIVTDANNRILSVNRSYELMSGYSKDELLGRDPSLLSSGQHKPKFYSELWSKLNEQLYWQGEVLNRRKSGELFPCWLAINVVKNTDGIISHYVGIANDLSKSRELQSRIEYLSQFDALTGLLNREQFKHRVQELIARHPDGQFPCAVLCLNLDRFKNINDSLGHAQGDDLLRETARRLSTVCHANDLLCRSGGDEFMLLIPDTHSEEHVLEQANACLKAVSPEYCLAQQSLRMTMSIGWAMYPHDASNSDSLISAADAALLAAKEHGRNTVRRFTVAMNRQARERLTLENQLRKALERNEFELFFQPQMDAKTLRCVGTEALVRWRSPELGLVAPTRFISMAEETGLIIPLGEWILAEAVRQSLQWSADGIPAIPVAVNISAIQFSQPRFLHKLRELMSRSGYASNLMELELTESMLMHDVDYVIAMLRHLKSVGFRLAIDDFGTGYSSLNYLSKLPIDVLKIDRTFISSMNGDAASLAIVQTILTLTKSLKLHSVAEGVENQAEVTQLAALGCDVLQGYYFAKPMPAADFAQWLKSSS